MPKIIVVSGHDHCAVHSLSDEAVIGRADDCDLILDHESVSRRHLRLALEGDGFFVEDLDSANGVSIASERIQSMVVASGTEIRVGRYILVPLHDYATTFRDRTIAFLPRHGGTDPYEPVTTIMLSPEELEVMAQQRKLIDEATIVSVSDKTAWKPGAHKLTFGPKGTIPVSGWLARFSNEIIAELSWNGAQHVIRGLSRWVGLRINGIKASQARLTAGDRLQIGSSAFRYETEE